MTTVEITTKIFFQRAIRNLYEIILSHQKEELPEDIDDLDIQVLLHRIADFVNDLTKIIVEIGLEAPKRKQQKNRNLTAGNRKKRTFGSTKLKKRKAISAN